jgi:hypothetical protein
MLLFTQNTKPDEVFRSETGRLKSLVADMERIGHGTMPDSMEGDHSPILNRWCLGSRVVPCLMGFSTGHPDLPGQGRLITTSDLWLLSEDMGWARTLSRWYRLGRPSDFSSLDS